MSKISTQLAGVWPHIEHVAEITSTNTELMERPGCLDGTVLVADSQTAGKGRMGRVWVAPPGTQATMSIALLVDSVDTIGTLPLAAGLAVTDALPGTVLKWPNDVLLEGKKLCGILAEAAAVDGGGYKVVLGIGINVTLQEHELPVPTATSLALAGIPMTRDDVVVAVLRALRTRVDQWLAGDPQLMVDYRKVCSSIGLNVRLEAPTGDVFGEVEGVADDGRIKVAGEYYSAGDVIHLRPS